MNFFFFFFDMKNPFSHEIIKSNATPKLILLNLNFPIVSYFSYISSSDLSYEFNKLCGLFYSALKHAIFCISITFSLCQPFKSFNWLPIIFEMMHIVHDARIKHIEFIHRCLVVHFPPKQWHRPFARQHSHQIVQIHLSDFIGFISWGMLKFHITKREQMENIFHKFQDFGIQKSFWN